MRKSILLTLGLALLSASSPSAVATPAASSLNRAGWHVEGCPPGSAENRQAFEESVRNAVPGLGVYTPNPFPEKETEVIENYLDYLRRASGWDGSSVNMDDVRDDYARALDAFTAGELTFEVHRVQEWVERRRCSPHLPHATYYLIRVFSDGRETMRGIELDSGVVVSTVFGGEEGFETFIRMDEARRIAREAYGLNKIQSMQYVHAAAVPGPGFCTDSQPCVAFRKGSDVYVLESDSALKTQSFRRLLRLDHKGRQARFTNELANQEQGLERMQTLWNSVDDSAGERWLSVGGRSQTAWLVEPSQTHPRQ